jgi:hypothetical protein
MSKEGALQMLTGETPTQVNPSLITPDMPKQEPTPTAVEAPRAEPANLESDRFARLSQREARLQQEREQLKAEKEKLRSVNEQVQRFQELKTKDPIAAFKELGFTETDFVNWAAEQNKELTPEEKMAQVAEKTANEKLEAYKKEQQSAQLKMQQERDNVAVTGYKQNLAKMIAENAEKYPGLAFQGDAGAALVYEGVLESIRNNPNEKDDPVTIAREIAEIYEDYQAEEFLEMAKLPKYQDKLKAMLSPEPLKPQTTAKPTRTRTLDERMSPATQNRKIPSPSNKDTATVAGATSPARRESPSEKRTRLENWLRNGKPS